MTLFAAVYLALSSLAYLCLIAWHHGSRADVLGHGSGGEPPRDCGGVCTTAGVAARMPRHRPSPTHKKRHGQPLCGDLLPVASLQARSVAVNRLDEIRQRLDAATPGPWERVGGAVFVQPDRRGAHAICYGERRCDDAALIAHAPADLRDLLAVAEAARDAFQSYYDDSDGAAPLPALIDELGEVLAHLDAGEVSA